MEEEGVKEIKEAVLIAALSALCGAFITFGAEEAKRYLAARREANKPKPANDPTINVHVGDAKP